MLMNIRKMQQESVYFCTFSCYAMTRRKPNDSDVNTETQSMPDFSGAPLRTIQRATVQLRDFTGRSTTATLQAGATATLGDFTAWRTAIGGLSNARVMETLFGVQMLQLNPSNPANTAYDDVYGTIDDALIFVFQNDLGNTQSIRVPAPDAQFFLSDGETPIDPDAGAGAGAPATILANVVALTLALLNAGITDEYSLARMYKEGVRRRQRTPLPLVEPGAGPPSDPPGV